MKRHTAVLLLLLAAVVAFPVAGRTQARGTQTAGSKPLVIYVVDTEGGKATLFVSPTGQSLLIDSGNPGERDLERIMAAITDAGLKRIDYLLTTHYHTDHVGGMQALAARIPIAHFIDHGPTVEEREQVAGFQAAYKELYSKAAHTVVKPGDRVPITGLDWRIVTAAGNVLKTPLPGGGKPNPACAGFTPKDITNDPENAQSVGSVITFGQFRAIDLGDLLWNKEFELMCPNNPIGSIDLYLVTHHGTDASGSSAIVHGLQPRVAVMQNGTRKGAGAQTMPTMRTSPGLEDIWQLHWGYGAAIEQNSAGVFIANVDEPAVVAGVLTAPPRGGGPGRGGAPGGGGPPQAAANTGGQAVGAPQPAANTGGQAAVGAPQPAANTGGQPAAGAPQAAAPAGPGGGRGGGAAAAHTPAYWIKISAEQNGTFTVTNSRNGFSKTYTKRPPATSGARQGR
jgi:beta-lactamase superfamily II metal-dependent hydrolase